MTTANSRAGATLSVTSAHAIEATGTSAAEDVYEVVLTLPPGRYTALRLEALPTRLPDGREAVGRNPADPNFVVSELTVQRLDGEGNAAGTPLQLAQPRASFAQEGWPVAAAIDSETKTGWAVSPRKHERHVAIFELAQPLELESAAPVQVTIAQHYGNQLTLAKVRLSTSTADTAKLTVQADSPECQKLREELATAQQQLTALKAQVPQLPIMRELAVTKQRTTRIHNRGSFLDQGEAVQPAVLAAFHPLPQSLPPSRLGVAHWLVSDDNPLTPRVWANRIWSRLFGKGLVETEEDFGAVGSPPSHPQLLDWLAAEYRDGGWSLKKLLKTIVLSDTYRQVSSVDAALADVDPQNAWLSRGRGTA